MNLNTTPAAAHKLMYIDILPDEVHLTSNKLVAYCSCGWTTDPSYVVLLPWMHHINPDLESPSFANGINSGQFNFTA